MLPLKVIRVTDKCCSPSNINVCKQTFYASPPPNSIASAVFINSFTVANFAPIIVYTCTACIKTLDYKQI